MTNLVLTFPDIDPVAIDIFGLKIHWYALMYLLGFAAAYLLMRRRLKHEPYRSITKPEPYAPAFIEDVLVYAIVGVLVGGRLGYCFFYKPSFYLQNPLEIVKIWDGGMSFHGGAIGVILALALLAALKKRPFLQVTDLVVPAVPLGLAAGRIGNFINGELWGRPASESLPWAMIFPTGGDVARHPSQLYQALLEGVLLFVIVWLFARKPRYRGQVSALFLMGYGALRFVGEFFREPDSFLGFLALNMSMGQWLSLPMFVAGLILFTWCHAQKLSDVEEGGDEADSDGSDGQVDDDEEPVDNSVDSDDSESDGDETDGDVDEGESPSEEPSERVSAVDEERPADEEK